MSPILFTFLGWNAAVYVGSEMRDPSRNLPRSLLYGLLLCMLVYVLVNAVYIFAIPVEALRSRLRASAGRPSEADCLAALLDAWRNGLNGLVARAFR